MFLDKHGTTNAADHLKAKLHYMTKNGPAPTSTSVYKQQLDSAYSQTFSTERFRDLLCRLIAVQHLPFSIVAAKEFQDVLKYASPNLRCNDALFTSGTTAKTELVAMFLTQCLQWVGGFAKTHLTHPPSTGSWVSLLFWWVGLGPGT
jgi:hypothetical protein